MPDPKQPEVWQNTGSTENPSPDKSAICSPGRLTGKCTSQVAYANPEELWQSVSGQEDKSWYAPAVEYWDQQPASYDGVLAGMMHFNYLFSCTAAMRMVQTANLHQCIMPFRGGPGKSASEMAATYL
jgi:hypothetical protein